MLALSCREMAVETEGAMSHAFDPRYEFDAPQFFDFDVQESEEEMRAAQLWFDGDHIYASSPFIMKIKKEILVQLGIQEGSGSKDGVECCSTGDANSEELAMVETAHREEQVVLDHTCASMCEDDKHRFGYNKMAAKKPLFPPQFLDPPTFHSVFTRFEKRESSLNQTINPAILPTSKFQAHPQHKKPKPGQERERFYLRLCAKLDGPPCYDGSMTSAAR